MVGQDDIRAFVPVTQATRLLAIPLSELLFHCGNGRLQAYELRSRGGWVGAITSWYRVRPPAILAALSQGSPELPPDAPYSTHRAVPLVELYVRAEDLQKLKREVEPDCEQPPYTISADGRSITIKGETLFLTSVQAEVVGVMDAQWKAGTKVVSKDFILLAIDRDNGRLEDIFKSRPGLYKKLFSSVRPGIIQFNI